MVTDELAAQAEEVLDTLDRWAYDCHSASLALVKSGKLGTCRVARGSCTGVRGGQHSWVVLGDDCYDDDAAIVDPTLWSYDDSVTGVWTGGYCDGRHMPFGKGSIWKWGRPDHPVGGGEIIELTPEEPWSESAKVFLNLLGPLDRRGWAVLAHAPVEEWPAREIIGAMYQDRRLAPLLPIDIVGMVTDLNPGGLYLP